ncbi:MAG: CinA family nicotinamide mononucleotide deamidase-related protein [Candidatus Hydrogenedentes bacterium]|nr:CinA family nicotinamide mononucleotide deamidase-related protein [Candidatus Hydrogenedentota bacterium]
MNVEIMMIGTELLLGQIQDTNATWMAQTLAEHGVDIYRKTTVGDNRARLVQALRDALERSDVVLCSGGLGPTEDDLTRECVAEVMGVELAYHPELFEEVVARFRHLNLSIPENNKKQAWLPVGARAIPNPNGTAPGLLAEDARGVITCMPGVPSELKPMLQEQVLPWMRERFGLTGVLHYRVLKVCGMGESRVDELIGDLITSSSNPTVGLLASPEFVRIRIAAKAATLAEAESLIDPMDAAVSARLKGRVMGRDEDVLEAVVDKLLMDRGWTLAVLETETGGLVCHKLRAAGSRALVGGAVYPVAELAVLEEGDRVDFIRKCLVPFTVTCFLGLVWLPEKKLTAVHFGCPAGNYTWEIPQLGQGARAQLRASIWALDCVRRSLVGENG